MPAYAPVEKSKTTVVTNKQRKDAPAKIYVGKNGYVQNAGYTIEPIAGLEKGPMDGPKAIVLHRTEGATLSSALNSAKSGPQYGTHFYVDKDGTVTQAASLLKATSHVGRIRSRCKDEGTPTLDSSQSKDETQVQKIEKQKKEIAMIESWGWAPGKIYNYEKGKSYPARYPMNSDSVGIETVGMWHEENKLWDSVTTEQTAAIARLVVILKNEYGLTDKDIFEHDRIAYKTVGEGEDLYPHTAHDGVPRPKE